MIPTDKPFELHVPVTSMPDFKGQPKITHLDIPVKTVSVTRRLAAIRKRSNHIKGGKVLWKGD